MRLKRVVIGAAIGLSMMASGSIAEESKPTTKDAVEVCKNLGAMARGVMTARQAGIPMVKMMELPYTISIGNEVFDKVMRELTIQIIVKAYDRPQYSTDPYKERAITDFENECFKNCFEAFTETFNTTE